MKVGITINGYFKPYLEEIAKLNNMSLTSICGLIVENFLSFNKKNKRFPLFQKQVNIVFSEKVFKSDLDNNYSDSGAGSVDQASESLNKEELLKKIEQYHVLDPYIDDDDLPF